MLAPVATAAVAARLLGGDPFGPGDPVLAPPSWSHPLGTDELGREILWRLLHGSRTALVVALASTAAATAVGLAVGLASGYVGGLVDDLLLKLSEIFEVVPRFLVALVAAALFGPRLIVVITVLALTFWPATARLARAEVFALREQEFVTAAHALGASPTRVLGRHLLPSALPPVIVTASFQAGAAVLIEGGLAFLGLGDPTVVSWGRMVADAQSYVHVAWWTSVFPGAAMAVTIMGLNLVGDGVDELLNAVRRDRRETPVHPGGDNRHKRHAAPDPIGIGYKERTAV